MSQTDYGHHISTLRAASYSNSGAAATNARNGWAEDVPMDMADSLGPSMGLAHDRVDGALKLISGIRADLFESAERVLGPTPMGTGGNVSQAPPTVVGSLPSLLQKLSWLHKALDDLTEQAQRFRAL